MATSRRRPRREDLRQPRCRVTMLVLVTVLIATLLLINPVYGAHPESSGPQILTSEGSYLGDKPRDQQKVRRMLIGSTAPTCTYNECRGCKFRCRAEQIPVDGNDPINSAYRYKCVCHR